MNRRPIHIHFGASKLALGLLLPIAWELGMASHVIGRPGVKEEKQYCVSFAPSRPKQYYPLGSFEGPENLADANAEILAALRDGRPMLVTATLRNAIVERQGLIRELLGSRRASEETIFLACENSPHPLYSELRREFEPAGVQFPATVVNRICPKFLDRDDGRRVVRAHELGEWLIERPRPGKLAMLLESSALVSMHDDLTGLEKRKRWVVNGGQLYLAILAHEAGEESLVEAANTPGIRDFVNHFHSETIRVLRAEHPDLQDNLAYAVDHCRAFCEVADDVPRMVSLQRADLVPFFETFKRRIGEPAALAAAADGEPPEVFVIARAAVDALLEREEAYDWGDPVDAEQPALLSAETDERAVQAYGAMLDGWVDAEEIAERCDRLEALFRSHRSFQQPISARLGLVELEHD
jgi:mannitol-1-phosphate/altronate dehydrogenase